MLNYAAGTPTTGYNLTRSLRFRASASAYLNRTFTTPTNNLKWTWSGWVKRGALSSSSYMVLMNGYQDDNNLGSIGFGLDSAYIVRLIGGAATILRSTNAVFRDPSAWYHVVFVYDSANATVANRANIYINGVLQTYATSNDPAGTGMYINAASLAQYQSRSGSTVNPYYFDGYMAEVNFIDGQALTPSSFGSYNSTTGVWQPAKYGGTYGTNGFYLPFTDNSALTTSSNVGLGKDFSGNGNYWTTNNISITAGATYDSMTDVPTLTSATASNFAVWNPLDKGANNTLSNGNLQFQITGGTQGSVRSTFALPSTGKWYWEVTMTALGPLLTGIATSAASLTNYIGSDAFGWGYNSGDGLVYNNGTTIRANATLAAGDIVGVAFDSGAGSLSFYKNNVLQTTAITGFTPATINYFIAAGVTGGAGILNCGQQPFAYTPPSGFVALNTYNLPTGTILQGNKVMDATLWTGDGAASHVITNAAAFKPDLVWIKARGQTFSNILTDSVRGATKIMESDQTAAEATQIDSLLSFNSNGFTVGTFASMNNNTYPYVGWQWQAGQGSSSSNTSGTITSTVSVNASAGFSIQTFTCPASGNFTWGHGLGVAPAMYIVKSRSTSGDHWGVYHQSMTSLPQSSFMQLDTTSAVISSSTVWANTNPTSSVISMGTNTICNPSDTAVCYAWATILGFSAFGSLTMNGTADNAFVYCGFKPKFILFKSFDSVGDWVLIDTSRDPLNVASHKLFPDTSGTEDASVNILDVLSNGFKIRAAYNGNWIYAAFASNPFKNSLAQ